MRGFPLASCLLLFAVPVIQAQSTEAAKPAALKWGPAPDAFPKGAKMAVVSGDPSQAQPFELELSFPNGYKVAPHFHPTAETIEVKKGTFLVGMGDRFDSKAAKPMKKGDHATMPAEQHHFAVARGATVVDVKSTGPFEITYVNPADDPRQKAKAKPAS
ncbi:MAG: cupin domain-containing protein [Gemmatimonadales bacterium]